MSFLFSVRLSRHNLPPLDQWLESLRLALSETVDVDAQTRRAQRLGERDTCWFPWPTMHLGFFVPFESARGVDVVVEGPGHGACVQVRAPALCSWTDWRLAVELAARVAEAEGEWVEGPEGLRLSPARAREILCETDDRWVCEIDEDVRSMRTLVVEEGRVVDLSGPHGSSWLGPRTWADVLDAGPEEAFPNRLVERIRDAAWARGYDGFHEANLLSFDGRTGREIRASVLAPDQPVLFRDPEFLLLSEGLEQKRPQFWLLPFSEIDAALPGLVRWLDDRTVAIAPIPRSAWAARLDSIRVRLLDLDRFLDEDGGSSLAGAGPSETLVAASPVAAAGGEPESGPAAGPKPRWKLW